MTLFAAVHSRNSNKKVWMRYRTGKFFNKISTNSKSKYYYFIKSYYWTYQTLSETLRLFSNSLVFSENLLSETSIKKTILLSLHGINHSVFDWNRISIFAFDNFASKPDEVCSCQCIILLSLNGPFAKIFLNEIL